MTVRSIRERPLYHPITTNTTIRRHWLNRLYLFSVPSGPPARHRCEVTTGKRIRCTLIGWFPRSPKGLAFRDPQKSGMASWSSKMDSRVSHNGSPLGRTMVNRYNRFSIFSVTPWGYAGAGSAPKKVYTRLKAQPHLGERSAGLISPRRAIRRFDFSSTSGVS
jgi:hypothetical protein